jgi:hypothetical protein
MYSALRLQRWWRKVLLNQSIRISAIAIQSLGRGWLARKQVKQITSCIYAIQVCVIFLLHSDWIVIRKIYWGEGIYDQSICRDGGERFCFLNHGNELRLLSSPMFVVGLHDGLLLEKRSV